MLGGVGLRPQEHRQQRTPETDRRGPDRQRVDAERLRLGLGGVLVRVMCMGLGHGFVRCCWSGEFNELG